MDRLSLAIPRVVSESRPVIGVTLREVKAWRDSLPGMDPEASLKKLNEGLRDANRAQADAQLRVQSLLVLEPAAISCLNALRGKYATLPLPLSEDARRRVEQMWVAQAELGYAYKLVLFDALNQQTHALKKKVPDLIYGTLRTLSGLLLDHYLYYYAEPERVWGEIGALYRYARGQNWHLNLLNIDNRHKDSIEQLFLRTVLLASVIPYRLMRGDILQVSRLMEDWGAHCRLRVPSPGWRPARELFIDLAQDRPPGCQGIPESDLDIEAVRILDVSGIQDLLVHQHSTLARGQSQGGRLSARKQRDLLRRLMMGWGGRQDRADDRNPATGKVDVMIGTTACAQAFGEASGGRKKNQSLTDMPVSSLSLVPKDTESWSSTRIQKGMEVKSRGAANFQIDDPNRDVWSRSASISIPVEIVEAQERERTLADHRIIRQINVSTGGMALDLDGLALSGAREGSLGVGDLLAVRPSGAAGARWRLGAIRWMRLFPSGGGHIGVMLLAETTELVTVRAVEGGGVGSAFIQAFLLRDTHAGQETASVVTPSAMFDEGTVLAIDSRGSKFRVKLVRQTEATDSFAQFSYKVL